MAWYDPRDWDPGRALAAAATMGMSEAGGLRSVADSAGVNVLGDPGAEAERQRKDLLYGQAQRAGQFAGVGERGYAQLGREAAAQRDYLRQTAAGQNSLSAEQLRQGLQQTQAAQLSMAAGAAPQDAAGAARTAAIQMGRLGSGMAGQQAIAGIQERAAAQRELGGMIMQQRGQDASVALGSRQSAMAGYGASNAGAPEKSFIEKYGPAAASAGAMIASDRRLKKDVRDADEKASRMLAGLKAFTFRYKDEKHGKGEQLGIMAQDLERAGLGHTVEDTPAGKMVHGGRLAASTAAMTAALARRVAKLEGARK